jgi:hypothetical protein
MTTPPVLLAVTVVMLGASGTVRGTTAGDDFDEYTPVPAAFTAATWNVYAVPLTSPVTFTDVAVVAARVNVVHTSTTHDCNV